MKIALRILIVPAVVWAILPPGAYGLLFLVVKDSSAIIDFVLVAACVVLGISAFKSMSFLIWIIAFTTVSIFGLIGFVHRFRYFGESGPLPFEWINNYFIHAIPLIFLSILMQAATFKTKIERPQP